LTSCEATLWISDSMLTCKTSFSLATSMRVILTAGANVGTGTDALSFAAGRVEKLYQGARNHSNLVPTMPGSAQVLGAFFRHQSYTITLEVGHTACERTDWVSTSTVSCSVPVGSKATQVLKFTASIRTLTTTTCKSCEPNQIHYFGWVKYWIMASQSVCACRLYQLRANIVAFR
jgi:hypothetical protein